MARTRHNEPDPEEDDDDEDWDEDEYDPEDPETYPAGLYDDDGPATVACPYCKAEILEDSEQCPKCGEFISREDHASGMRWSAWLLIVLMLLAVGLMILGRG
ncbi:MAG: hypothetical protein C0467_01360 [Planctomycetaceae bacterium]|nr:hypothetical protein [Planctomycetaceae bacterium]